MRNDMGILTRGKNWAESETLHIDGFRFDRLSLHGISAAPTNTVPHVYRVEEFVLSSITRTRLPDDLARLKKEMSDCFAVTVQ